MTEKRKRNTPKKYPNPGTGAGKNPRILCPECEKDGLLHYVKKTKCQYRVAGKIKTVTPLAFCKFCKHVIFFEDEINKIPD